MRGKEQEGTCTQGWRQGRARGRWATETAVGTAWEVNALPLWLVFRFRRWRRPSVLLPSAAGTLCYGQGASTDLSPRPGASGKPHPAPNPPSANHSQALRALVQCRLHSHILAANWVKV